MLIFFLTVFVVYFAANYYLFIKGYRALNGVIDLSIYTIIFFAIALTFIVGKILERSSTSVIVDILNVIGGFWLAFMLYAILLLLIADITLPIVRATGLISAENREITRFYSYIATIAVTLLILAAGFLNAVSPVTKRYTLNISTEASGVESVRIAAVSDVHLGSIVRRRSLRKLSEMIAKAEPDILLFLGDLVDGEINPVLRDDLLSSLIIPETVKEVFAITGNHEFIGGYNKTIEYIENSGIDILKDEVVESISGVQFVGRIDRDSFRYTGRKRMDMEELIAKTDPTKPVIILDHQPRGSRQELNGKFDLMLSGHTHNGQMWPFSYLVKSIYRDSHGYSTDGNHHFIVSSGFGTWGPRIRIGSRSELIVIDLNINELH
jgi:hypothetical protein